MPQGLRYRKKKRDVNCYPAEINFLDDLLRPQLVVIVPPAPVVLSIAAVQVRVIHVRMVRFNYPLVVIRDLHNQPSVLQLQVLQRVPRKIAFGLPYENPSFCADD